MKERYSILLSDVTTSLTIYLMLCLTDNFIIDAETQDNIGIFLISLSGVNFTITMVMFLFTVILMIKFRIKKKKIEELKRKTFEQQQANHLKQREMFEESVRLKLW